MGRTKNTVTLTAEDKADDKMTHEQKAEAFYKFLNSAMHDVETTGIVSHESAVNISKALRWRMGDKTPASVFGTWQVDMIEQGKDFMHTLSVNRVIMSPISVSKNPKLTDTERWQARLAVLNRAYSAILNDMTEAGMSEDQVAEIEWSIDQDDYNFPDHLSDRIEAVKNAAYVGTVERGRKAND